MLFCRQNKCYTGMSFLVDFGSHLVLYLHKVREKLFVFVVGLFVVTPVHFQNNSKKELVNVFKMFYVYRLLNV